MLAEYKLFFFFNEACEVKLIRNEQDLDKLLRYSGKQDAIK